MQITLEWDPSLETITPVGEDPLDHIIEVLVSEGVDALDGDSQIDASDFIADLRSWVNERFEQFYPNAE